MQMHILAFLFFSIIHISQEIKKKGKKMKKNIIPIFMLVVIFTSVCFSSGIAADDTVKIGVVYPLSGNQALTGFEYRAGCELAEEIINNEHPEWAPLKFAETAGIPALNGKKIEIVYGDSQATPERGQNEAERLITQEGVVALIGAFNSSVSTTTSQVAERYGIPFICDSASSPTLTSRGFQYFFRVFGNDAIFVENLFTAMREEADKDTSREYKTVMVLNENSLWGSDVADIAKLVAPKYGFEVIDQISYPSTTTQVNSEVQRVIAKDPDILFQASYVADAMLFMRTFKEQKYTPKMYVYADGKPLNFSYRETLGPDGWWTVFRTVYSKKDAPFVKPITEDYFAEHYPDLKFNENQGSVITSVQVLVDAINRAGTTDPEKLREALTQTDIKGEEIILPFAGVQFDETGQNILARAIVVQAQEDFKFVNLWPSEMKNGDYVPYPSWEER